MALRHGLSFIGRRLRWGLISIRVNGDGPIVVGMNSMGHTHITKAMKSNHISEKHMPAQPAPEWCSSTWPKLVSNPTRGSSQTQINQLWPWPSRPFFIPTTIGRSPFTLIEIKPPLSLLPINLKPYLMAIPRATLLYTEKKFPFLYKRYFPHVAIYQAILLKFLHLNTVGHMTLFSLTSSKVTGDKW